MAKKNPGTSDTAPRDPDALTSDDPVEITGPKHNPENGPGEEPTDDQAKQENK